MGRLDTTLEPPEPHATFRQRVTADSVVWRAVAGACRQAFRGGQRVADLVRRVDAALGRVPLPGPDPADEARVKNLIASSRLVRWIDAALDVPPRAWQSSVVRRWMQPTIDAVRTMPPAERLRQLALTLLVATLTHVVLVLLVAEPVGWPTWTAWGGLTVAALVAAWRPAEVLTAWTTSRLRQRMTRRDD